MSAAATIPVQQFPVVGGTRIATILFAAVGTGEHIGKRKCGFSQVSVTKKSGDGGIDGTGKLRINGIFSFNVAFQCKRYVGSV